MEKLFSFYKSEEARKLPKRMSQEDRPSTQRNYRRKGYFFSTDPNESSVLSKTLFKKPESIPTYFLNNDSQKSQPLFQQRKIRTRSQLRDKIPVKSQNYSKLRKNFERDFYVGSSVHSFQNTKPSSRDFNRINDKLQISAIRKKGKLWVGRPILLFQPIEAEKSFF